MDVRAMAVAHPQLVTSRSSRSRSRQIATSEQTYEHYNEAVAAWGKRGWAAVALTCGFFKGMGMAVDCPAP